MFSGIISLTFAQYPDHSAKELWYQDLKTIVYMAQSAVKLNALSMDPAQMNLNDFDSIKNIVAGIFDIKLLSGNVEGGMEYGRKLVMRYMDRLLRNHTYYY